MYDENNIFAKIIRGEIPCNKIYEDENCLFFYDINPAAKIHVLGIPKSPCVNLSEFVKNNNSSVISDFFKKVDLVIEELGIKNDGYRLVSNSGKNGRQEVPHFHIHILGGEDLASKL
tara:strand:+ start:8865 stop:9215 length:351 start_codon:yes stop_codon:yes gene_type:complete